MGLRRSLRSPKLPAHMSLKQPEQRWSLPSNLFALLLQHSNLSALLLQQVPSAKYHQKLGHSLKTLGLVALWPLLMSRALLL